MPLPVLVEQLCEDCRFCWWPLLRFVTFHSSFNQNSIQLFCIRIASSRFPPVFGLFFLCEGTEQKKSSSERHTCIASSRFELRILQSSAVLKCYCDDFIRFLRSCMHSNVSICGSSDLFLLEEDDMSAARSLFIMTVWLWRRELSDHMRTVCTACSLALNDSIWRQITNNTEQICFIFIIRQTHYWVCVHTSGCIGNT